MLKKYLLLYHFRYIGCLSSNAFPLAPPQLPLHKCPRDAVAYSAGNAVAAPPPCALSIATNILMKLH